MVIVCVMSVPHISLTLSVMIVPSCGLASVRPTRCGASKPFSRITRRTRRGLARTPAKRNRAHNLRVALAVKAGGIYLPADMICQFRVAQHAGEPDDGAPAFVLRRRCSSRRSSIARRGAAAAARAARARRNSKAKEERVAADRSGPACEQRGLCLTLEVSVTQQIVVIVICASMKRAISLAMEDARAAPSIYKLQQLAATLSCSSPRVARLVKNGKVAMDRSSTRWPAWGSALAPFRACALQHSS